MADNRRGSVAGGRASLIGGIFVGIAVFLIWLAAMREIGTAAPAAIAAGAVVATAIATWIRLADL